MKEFIKKMLSTDGEVSSKRVAALFTLLNMIVLAYIATFTSADKVAPKFMYDALALIVGGGLGLTVIEKIFGNKSDDTKPDDTKSDDVKPA
jgi:lipoprotein signal peptidase